MNDAAAQPVVTPAVPQGPRKAAVLFIFATALMDVISLGIMIPVLPNLVKQFAGGDTALAAQYTIVFAMTWGLMQFFFGPIVGMLSDRFGRRPVLLLSIFGLGVDYIFMALAPTLGWLFVGRVINGITSASFSTANAYVADVTPPQERAKAFGLLGAAFGVGFIVGPAIGGVLGDINLRLPFWVSAGLAAINWLYGFFVLPESLPPERRAPALNWRKANPVGSLSFLRERTNLFGLVSINVLFLMAHNVFPSIFVLFVGYRFNWGPQAASMMLVATGLSQILVQTLVVGRVVKAAGERGALLIGLVSATLAFLTYGLAATPFWFFCGVPAGALGALVMPGLQSLMSRRVAANEQGRLQGLNSAFMGLTAIFGPLLYLSLLAFAVRHDVQLHQPGIPILVAAVFCLSAFGLAVKVARPVADVH
ncbi:MAG TPA: TCR/Tet family MFS transporter [Steroidobacteraceae bacterium]|jgi:DHA1 family tetracycline resistance protein-like MFS transporter